MPPRRSTRVPASRGRGRGHSASTHGNPLPPPPAGNQEEMPNGGDTAPLSLFVSSRTRAALHLVTRNFCFGDLYSFDRETDDLPPPPVQTAPARATRAPREYYFRLDLNLLDLLGIIKVIDLFAVRARPLEVCSRLVLHTCVNHVVLNHVDVNSG
ncbi:hypothetical protein GQ457_09G018900 [Hibiscus cannabinus]